MKKLFSICLLLFVSGLMNAQDIIVKKDGSIIKVKVLEVSEEAIKYKKIDKTDGPTYSVLKSNLTSINYENGEVENFVGEQKNSEKSEVIDEDSENEEKPKKNPLLEDANFKKSSY